MLVLFFHKHFPLGCFLTLNKSLEKQGSCSRAQLATSSSFSTLALDTGTPSVLMIDRPFNGQSANVTIFLEKSADTVTYEKRLIKQNALQRLKPVNEVSVFISSRTDTGVHALCNSAHVDIQRRGDKPPFTEQTLTDALNFYLKQEPIRITRAYRIRSNFHARYCALSRTYVYRLATGVRRHTELPVTEKNLCWTLGERELDVGAMQQAGAMLLGTHDFSTFRALSTDAPFKDPVKTILLVQVQPGVSFSQRHFHRDIQFWELTFKSRSFLYKQVRRMAGALVAVGQGKLAVSQVQELLDTRDSTAYPQNMAAPSCGLFLTNVEYSNSDLMPYIQD